MANEPINTRHTAQGEIAHRSAAVNYFIRPKKPFQPCWLNVFVAVHRLLILGPTKVREVDIHQATYLADAILSFSII